MTTQIPPEIWRFRISAQHFYSFHAVTIFLSELYMLYTPKRVEHIGLWLVFKQLIFPLFPLLITLRDQWTCLVVGNLYNACTCT